MFLWSAEACFRMLEQAPALQNSLKGERTLEERRISVDLVAESW
jgi:hypothetical protein